MSTSDTNPYIFGGSFKTNSLNLIILEKEALDFVESCTRLDYLLVREKVRNIR
jgi:hypothetical protein